MECETHRKDGSSGNGREMSFGEVAKGVISREGGKELIWT
jgi:hypothetical protein